MRSFLKGSLIGLVIYLLLIAVVWAVNLPSYPGYYIGVILVLVCGGLFYLKSYRKGDITNESIF